MMDKTTGLSIGDVAKRTGLSTSAIRYYERNGLLVSPQRVNGRRRYSGEALQTIALIHWGRDAGLSIRELRTLLNGFPAQTPASDRWHQVIPPKLDEITALVERLMNMKAMLESTLNCTCSTFADCAATFKSAT